MDTLVIRACQPQDLSAFFRARDQAYAEFGLPVAETNSDKPWDEFSRRFVARVEGTGELAGIVAVALPGAGLYEFESQISFPHDAIPTRDRSDLAEGHALYVAPDFRHTGLGLVLAFLAPLVAFDRGARWLVMGNNKTVPAMIPDTAWRDTGVIIDSRGFKPMYLFVGETENVLRVFGPMFTGLMRRGDIALAPEVASLVDAWRATL